MFLDDIISGYVADVPVQVLWVLHNNSFNISFHISNRVSLSPVTTLRTNTA